MGIKVESIVMDERNEKLHFDGETGVAWKAVAYFIRDGIFRSAPPDGRSQAHVRVHWQVFVYHDERLPQPHYPFIPAATKVAIERCLEAWLEPLDWPAGVERVAKAPLIELPLELSQEEA